MNLARTLVVVGLGAIVAPFVGVACSKNDDTGKAASVPPLDPAAAKLAAAPTPPPVPPPAPSAPAEPAAAADPSAKITGKIVLPPAQAKLKPQGTLFLTARRLSDNPSARGTLVAVKKLPATSFPLPFTLSAADMPFQNGAFDGELTLTARIDRDGDPMSREKGDVFGGLPKVRVGSRDVVISLDQVQKEAESLAQPGAGPGPMAPRPPGLPPGHP